MRVLVVSGIWPPDVGGPATHAPELAEWLRGRGHRVEVVTTADGAPAPRSFPVHWTARRLGRGARHAHSFALVARRALASDVVYTTGMFTRSAAGAAAAARPLVVKLTGDPAFERARWRGLVDGDVDGFQRGGGGAIASALRVVRDLSLRRAAAVICPSSYLRELAIRWGIPPDRIHVVPNPTPPVPELPARGELRRRLGLTGATLAFAGRLTAQKSLDVALDALAPLQEVRLVIAGDGPERAALEARAAALGLGGRVQFVGTQPRERVLELLHAADAALLPSSWENFPHSVVEALGVGTPVVATAVGGVAEVVRDGENGLLVPRGDPASLGAAVERLVREPGLQESLRRGAERPLAGHSADEVLGRIEAVLARAVR